MEGRAAAVRGAAAAVLGDGRERDRRIGCFAALLRERRLLGHVGRGGGYTRLCRAMDQGAALPRQDRWRGRAFPRQRSAVMVAATSGLCRAAMHGRAMAIGAAKSVSFKKN